MRPLAVGIATFRRASLGACLASLAQQTRRPDRVIVADNDATPSSKTLAENACADACLDLTYLHAPARNISIARNAVLTAIGGELLAWIDDDETAPPDWLHALERAMGPGLAGVFGPSRAVYPDGAPAWMRELAPHDQVVPVTKGTVRYGHTANALTDPSDPALAGLRFDEAYGRSGGEDADYFYRGWRSGARYALLNAPVLEPVAPDRLSADWLLERRRRAGALYHASLTRGAAGVGVAAVPKAAVCAIRAASARSDATSWRHRLRGHFHRGVIDHAIGVRPRDHYAAGADTAEATEASQPARDRSQ